MPPPPLPAQALKLVGIPLLKLRQPTPVNVAIVFKIKKDKNIKNSPKIANVKVFLAPSTDLESPPEKSS
jgi:hypothetical protein